MTRTIDTLAGFVHASSPADIPQSVMERASDCVLDAIGSAAGGFRCASTRAMNTAMPVHAGEAVLWFDGSRRDTITAATLNAMAATALDIDDGHRRAAGHPGAAIVAAALAAAKPETEGKDLLAAVVLGYEVSVNIALARVPEHHGSTVSGRWSGTGAAAAVAKLQGLAPDVIAQSILIAEQHAPRAGSAATHGFAGSDVKEAIAWSVHSALHAVHLAKAGFRAYPDTFEQGVLYDPAVVTAELESFAAISGLFFKPYACCRWIHAAIDALFTIMAEHDISAPEVDAIAVRTFNKAADLGNHVRPASEAEAQFSIPFCLAVAACRGRSALLPLDLSLMRDSDVLAVSRRVSICRDDDMQSLFPRLAPSIVEVSARGETFVKREEAAFGDPTNPMDRGDLQAKFLRLTEPVVGAARGKHLADNIAGLDSAYFRDLSDLLGAA